MDAERFKAARVYIQKTTHSGPLTGFYLTTPVENVSSIQLLAFQYVVERRNYQNNRGSILKKTKQMDE